MKLRSQGIRFRLILKKIVIDFRRTHLKDLRNNFLLSLKKLPNIVHLKNLVLFGSVLAVITMALFVQRFGSLRRYYIVEEPNYGGSYSEGVVGTVEKINPLFIQNEAEKAASSLVFSGLTRVVDGTKVVPDLADSWEVLDNGKTYDFKFKQNVYWHDQTLFNVDDVIYTVNLIQNSDTKTDLGSIWKGVTVEKVGDYELKISLPNPYPNFLVVASQAILPEHLLSAIDPKNIKVAEFNNAPVGTGPYEFVRFDQIGNQPEIIFKRNDKFQISKPYLDQIKLVLYENDNLAFDGLARKQVDGLITINPQNYSDLARVSGINDIYRKLLPEYQVVYFNLKNSILSDKEIRKAISAAVDRQELVDKVLLGNGEPQTTPLMPGQPGYSPKVTGIVYNPEQANSSLDSLGWAVGDDGIRQKEDKKLSFRLVFADNYESQEDAKLLKAELGKIGVNVDLLPVSENQIGPSYIKPRNFDLLLITQNVGFIQDWYSLWDSTQITSPGQNLSGFSDKKLDRFVEQVRGSTDKDYIAERMKQAQDIIVDNAPIIYLYRPVHLFASVDKLRGMEQSRISAPTDILNNVFDWYVNVKS